MEPLSQSFGTRILALKLCIYIYIYPVSRAGSQCTAWNDWEIWKLQYRLELRNLPTFLFRAPILEIKFGNRGGKQQGGKWKQPPLRNITNLVSKLLLENISLLKVSHQKGGSRYIFMLVLSLNMVHHKYHSLENKYCHNYCNCSYLFAEDDNQLEDLTMIILD